MSRSFMLRLFLSLSLCLTPTGVLAWDYVPYKGDNLGYLSGGTFGTLYREHPNETNNIFSPDGSGDEELFFDDDENHTFGGVLVKAQNTRGGCTWYEYQGAAKFGEKYFLGLPKSIHDGDCNKP
jgi:hypothetical protein